MTLVAHPAAVSTELFGITADGKLGLSDVAAQRASGGLVTPTGLGVTFVTFASGGGVAPVAVDPLPPLP